MKTIKRPTADREPKQIQTPGIAATADDRESLAPMESLMTSIRLDASRDSMRYLLRSDTGHDGE